MEKHLSKKSIKSASNEEVEAITSISKDMLVVLSKHNADPFCAMMALSQVTCYAIDLACKSRGSQSLEELWTYISMLESVHEIMQKNGLIK